MVEEAVLEAVLEAAVEQKADEKISENQPVVEPIVSGKKRIKDYLSKDLFSGIKVISGKEDEQKYDCSILLVELLSTFNDISENQIISAKVIGISDNDVMVDIGFKSEGLISRSEFNNKDLPEIGSDIDIFLEKFEDTDGNITLSKYKADFIKRWDELRTFEETKEPVHGKIIKRVKGGLVVDLGVIQAFLPGSQADVQPIKNFDDLIGKELDFQIVKVDEMRKNLVVSRKAILEESLNEKRQELMTKIEVGAQLQGLVKNITDFGVFVDLGGVDGLVHITDFSWGRINHPEDVLKLDEKVNIVVLDFDDEKKRIMFGKNACWVPGTDHASIATEAKVVARLKEQGIEGLIHISEIDGGSLRSAQDFVNVGDKVQAQVLTMDREERKMSLGIKQLTPDPWTDITTKYPVGSTHKGIVRNFTNFGVFVELEEGIDGLIYISDLSWTKKVKHPSEFTNISDTLEVVVLELDVEGRKLSLGHKQTTENPWDKYEAEFAVGSVHKASIDEMVDKGAVINFNGDITAFVPKKDYLPSIEPGGTIDILVVEVNEQDKNVILMLDQPDAD